MTTELRRRFCLPLFLFLAMIAAAPAAQAQQLAITSIGDYGTLSIGEVHLPFTATGGSGNYFWSIVNPALQPPGLAIRNDLPPQYAPATIGLSGIATTPGTYVFDVQVDDGVNLPVVKTGVTVKITSLRITTPYNLPDAYEGSLYSTQLSAAGGVGLPSSWVWSGTTTAGLSLASDGTLSGTPAGQGFWNVPLQVTDGVDTVGWSPSVGVFDVQITTNPLLPYATINQPYSQAITASGGAGGYVLSFSGGLPNGVSFVGGTIQGTPTQAGRYTFSITATDTNNHFDRRGFSLVVVAVPAVLPQVQLYGSRLDDCAVGEQCQRSIGNWSAAQPLYSPLSWSASGLPDGMSIRSGSGVTSVWPGDVELFGSPSTAGDFDITATVTDGTGATATNTFPLHVSNIWVSNYPPSGTVGLPYSHTFRVLGGGASYTATLTGGTLPLGLTLGGACPSAISICGTPTEGGSFSPVFTFTDGSGNTSTVTTYFYIANAGNTSQPLAINNSDLGTATLNVSWQYQLSACCRNSLTWTVESGSSLPAGLSLSAGGLLSGTPTVAGQSTFVVRATDASVPADYTTRQLTLNVTPLSITTNFTLPYGNVNTAYSKQLQAAGGTGPYNWTIAPGSFLPPGLSLTLGGLLAGTPTGSGQFNFTINVLDTATSNKTTGYFSLAIYPAGVHPSPNITTNGNFGTWSLGIVQTELVATGGAGGYTWSLLSGTLPPGLAIRTDFPSFFSQSASGGLIGVATTPGVYPFTLRVTDQALATADLAGTLTVAPLTLKEQSGGLPDGFKNDLYSYTLTPVGNIGAVTWGVASGSALPPGLALNTGTGLISGTPTTDGVYNPRLTLTADGATVFVNVSINVYVVNVGTSTPLAGGGVYELPNAIQNSAYSATFTATGCTVPCTFLAPNGLPNGLSLNPTSGVVSGPYTGGTGGRFTFNITATDPSAGKQYTRRFAVRGVTAGVLPAIGLSGQRLDDCTIGVGCSRTVFVSSAAAAPFTWSASGLPAGMTLRPGGVAYRNDTTPAGDATIWGVPTQLGDFNVTITVSNATGSTSNTFPLHVSELYLDSNLPNGTYNAPYGPGGLGAQLRVLGGTASYSTTLMSPTPGNRLPIGLSLNGALNKVTGTPLETGGFSPDLQIVDTANPVHRLRLYKGFSIPDLGNGTVQITTGSDLGFATLNSSYSKTFSACCLGSYAWSLESGTLPTGTLLNTSTGVLSGTLTAAGTFTFALRVRDSNNVNNFAIRQFTLTVTSISTSGSTTLLPGDVGSFYSQPLPVSGATGVTTWSLMPFNYLPPGLGLSSPGPNGAGRLSGTPTAAGFFSFALKATDGVGQTLVQTYNVTIYPNINAYPNPNCDSLGPNLTFSLGTLTQGLTCGAGGSGTGYQYSLTPGATTVTGMRVQQGPPLPTSFATSNPPAGAGLLGVLTTPGVYPTSIRVTDSLGHFGDRPITVTVPPLQILSQTTLPKATRNVPYSFQLTGYGGAGTFSLPSGSSLPAGLALSGTGLISGTPTSTAPPLAVTNKLHAGTTATLTVGAHGLVVGDTIVVALSPADASFDGTFTVTAFAGTTVSYTNAAATVASTASGGTVAKATTATANFNVAFTSGGQTVTVSFSLTVNAFDITATGVSPTGSGVLPLGTVNAFYSQAFADSGCTGTCSWSVSGQPNTLSINGSGVLNGTPTAPTNTSITVTRTSVGGNGTVSRVFSLQILPAAATVLSISTPSATYPATGSFFSVGGNMSQGLFAAGGIPLYTWTLDSGALPTGVSLLSPGQDFGRDFVPGLTYLVGKTMVAGTYTFTLKATDSASPANFVTRTYTWTVGALALATNYNSLPLSGTTLIAGTPYTQALLGLGGTATEGTGNYAWANLSPLPLGLTLTSGGVLSGTTNEAVSNFSVPVQITDTTSLVKLVSNITLNVTGPAVIGGGSAVSFSTNGSLGTSQAGSLFSTSIGVTGGTPFAATPGPSYILTVESPTSLPPGFTLLTGDAVPAGTAAGSTVLSGTPSSPGAYTFTLRATDLVGNFALRTFTLTVVPIALATNTTLPDGGVGESYSQRLLAWDNTSSVVWSVSNGSSLPPGLSLVTGVLTTGAGTLTQAGSFTFSLDGADGSGTVFSANYNLKVTSFRITSPQELPQPAILGVPFTYQFTASAAATWQANSGLPSGSPGFNLSPTGLLTGTLSTVTVGSPFSFTVQATVGGVSQVRRFVLYQRFPNRAVLDLSINNTLLADATVGLSAAYPLTPNGGTPAYTWSIGSALPPGLNLVTAAFNGSPAPANNISGFVAGASLIPGGAVLAGTPSAAGDYSFELILTDSLGAVSRRTFSLHVSQVSILQSGLNPAKVGTAYSRQFTAAGGTGSYTFTMKPASRIQDMLPPGLTLTTGGLLSGTPAGTGSYAFFLEAKDGLDRTFTRRYTLFVTNTNLLFVSNFNQVDTSVGVDSRLLNNQRSLTLGVNLLSLNANGTAGTNSPASGTFTWTLKNGTLPPGMSLLTGDLYADPGQTVLGGQPTAAGQYVFTLTATKVGSPAVVVDHTFTFRVAPMQAVAPPTEVLAGFDLPTAHVGEFYTTTLKMAGGTPPPYTFVQSPFVPLPSWLTLDPTGVLSGTPPSGAIGSYTISPVVTDAASNELNFIALLVVTSGPGAAMPLASIPANLELPYGSAGLPYNYPLDFVLRGGTPPFTWSVAPGSALPPGLSLLPGANGVSTYLSGVPFSDEFRFSLLVQDSGSPQQSLTVALLLEVPSLALTPDTLAPGIVGVPYGPVTLTPSGGTAPYTVFAYPLESDFPPGLSLGAPNCAVLQLCGTPTAPGNFPIVLAVLDSAGQALGRSYRFVVDNPTIAQPLGEAPGVSLAPTPVEVSYRVGDPNPAPTPFSVNATSGTFAYGLSIAGVPGATLSSGTGTAPGASSVLWDMTGVAIGTYRGVLGVRAPAAVNLVDQVPVTLRVTVPCNYALNPTGGSAAAAGGSGAFGMATGGDCSWTAVSNDPWIAVTSASSGTGSATINYSVAPNDNGTPLDPLDDPLTPRIGTINVHGQLYSITQFGSSCAFGISPSSLSVPASGGQAVVSVTASNSGCQWTASGLGATWANAPTPVSGSGTVTVTIPANPLPQNMPPQTATIAGLTFTVYQGGVACNVGLSASSASSPAGGGPGFVSVTRVDGCAYDTVVGPSWVSVTSGGSHDDSFSGPPLNTVLNYEVQPNSTTYERKGTLTIGGQEFEITQAGLACSVTLDTSNLGSPYGPGPFAGVVGTIGVTANGANCSWVAESGADWASISPGSGGGVASTIQVRVTGNNDSLTSRTTDLFIAGQVVSIEQAGITCTYGMQSSTGSFPASGGFGTVGMIAPSLCGWTAQSNDPWLTVVSPLAPGASGSGNILFSVAANGPVPPTPRVGTLSIRNPANAIVRTYTVTEAPLACSYTLPLSGVTLPSSGTGGPPSSFAFSAPAGCAPTAVSYASWVTVASVGADFVEYLVEPNPTAQQRKGTIQLGNQTFTITEQGATCGYSINPYGSAFGKSGGSGVIFGTTTSLLCTPDVSTNQPGFISLVVPPTEDPVTHEFTLPYSVLPYISLNPNVRYGNITFGGRVHTVKQTSW